MRRYLPLALACSFACVAFSADLKVEAEVESVSVYLDAARVTRVASVDLPAGVTKVVFEGIPSRTAFSELGAAIQPVCKIRNARGYLAGPDEEVSPDEKALVDEIEALASRIEEQQSSINAAKVKARFATDLIASFSRSFGQLAENGESLDVAQAGETLAYAEQLAGEAAAVTAEASKAIKALNEQKGELEKQLAELRQGLQKTRGVVEIEVELPEAAGVELSLSYVVAGASWRPHYEIRALPDSGSLTIESFAQVTQNTGEDWEQVILQLQANPVNQSGTLPSLSTLQVYKVEDGWSRRGSYSMKEAYEPAMMEADSLGDREVQVSRSTTSFEVTLPQKASLLSVEGAQSVPLLETELVAEYWSEAVPSQQLEAFLMAKASNTSDMPLLPGSAVVFVDGKLTAKVGLPKTLPTQELTLSLGVDQNVQVKRIEGVKTSADTGFLDKTTTLTRSFRNLVTSYHAKAHKLIITDQFPVSTNEKIVIERLAPKAGQITVKEENKDNGIFQWELSAEPGKERAFLTEYTITYPRDWAIAPAL